MVLLEGRFETLTTLDLHGLGWGFEECLEEVGWTMLYGDSVSLVLACMCANSHT